MNAETPFRECLSQKNGTPVINFKEINKMRLVIALGGNALLKRGEPMRCENQRANVRIACQQIAKAYEGNELVISHGNAP